MTSLASLGNGEAVLRPYDQTWRDRAASWMLGPNPTPERVNFVQGLVGSRGLGTTGMALADATPAGSLFALQEGARARDPQAMSLAAMGLLPGAGAAGKTGMAIEDEIRSALQNAIAVKKYKHIGLRVTEKPLVVGEKAPPSMNYYQDFVSEDHPDFGRSAFPLHMTPLPGPSVVGVTGAQDIDTALAAAKLGPKANWHYYPGDHVSIIGSNKRLKGEDAGEWVLPDGVVLSAFDKSKSP